MLGGILRTGILGLLLAIMANALVKFMYTQACVMGGKK